MYDRTTPSVNRVLHRSSTGGELAERLLLSGVARDRGQALEMAAVLGTALDEHHKDLHLAIIQNYGPGFQIGALSKRERTRVIKSYNSGELTFRPSGSA